MFSFYEQKSCEASSAHPDTQSTNCAACSRMFLRCFHSSVWKAADRQSSCIMAPSSRAEHTLFLTRLIQSVNKEQTCGVEIYLLCRLWCLIRDMKRRRKSKRGEWVVPLVKHWGQAVQNHHAALLWVTTAHRIPSHCPCVSSVLTCRAQLVRQLPEPSQPTHPSPE